MSKQDFKKRGFTLAETVVAITIILIVSFTVISTAAFSSSLSKRADAKIFFYNQMENLLQCYIADGFGVGEYSALRFLFGDVAMEESAETNATLFRFGYDGDCRILTGSETLDLATYVLEVRKYSEVSGGGFSAQVYLARKPETRICELEKVFYASDDYVGGTL